MEEYNPQQQPQPQQPYNGMQQPLPNATVSLVLGILSLVGICCYGIIGAILGIIAIVLSNKDSRIYQLNPGMYTISSYNNSKAGKICGIISTVLGCLYLLLIVFLIAVFGIAVLSNPQALRDAMMHANG